MQNESRPRGGRSSLRPQTSSTRRALPRCRGGTCPSPSLLSFTSSRAWASRKEKGADITLPASDGDFTRGEGVALIPSPQPPFWSLVGLGKREVANDVFGKTWGQGVEGRVRLTPDSPAFPGWLQWISQGWCRTEIRYASSSACSPGMKLNPSGASATGKDFLCSLQSTWATVGGSLSPFPSLESPLPWTKSSEPRLCSLGVTLGPPTAPRQPAELGRGRRG